MKRQLGRQDRLREVNKKTSGNAALAAADLLDHFAAAIIERSGMPRPQKRRQSQAILRPALGPLKEILKYKSRQRSRVYRKGSYPQRVTAPALSGALKGIK